MTTTTHAPTTPPRSKPPVLTLTDRAARRVRDLMAQADRPVKGVRISVTNKGCSGMAYKVEYVSDEKPLDEKVVDKDVTVYVDPYAVMFILGSTMDYAADTFQSGFTFENPNEKGRCGCGESFHV